MKLTNKNCREIEILEMFKPAMFHNIPITDNDIKRFFDYSDRGRGKDEYTKRIANETQTKKYTGLSAMHWAKRNRDLTVRMWEEDWGSTLNAYSFVPDTRPMAEFASKSLHKLAILISKIGKDAA